MFRNYLILAFGVLIPFVSRSASSSNSSVLSVIQSNEELIQEALPSKFNENFFVATHFCHHPLQVIKKNGLTPLIGNLITKEIISSIIFRPHCVLKSDKPFVCKIFPNKEKNKYERLDQVKIRNYEQDGKFILVSTGKYKELPGIQLDFVYADDLIFPTYFYDEARQVGLYKLFLDQLESAAGNVISKAFNQEKILLEPELAEIDLQPCRS